MQPRDPRKNVRRLPLPLTTLFLVPLLLVPFPSTGAAVPAPPPEETMPLVIVDRENAVDGFSYPLEQPFLLRIEPGPWPADYPGLIYCGHTATGPAGCGYEDVRLDRALPLPLTACSYLPTNHACYAGWSTIQADWGIGGRQLSCTIAAAAYHIWSCYAMEWGEKPRPGSLFDLRCSGWGYGDYGCAWIP